LPEEQRIQLRRKKAISMTGTIIQQRDRRLFFSAVFLVVLHLTGIIGMHSSYEKLFLQLTPFNLLISTFLLLFNHKEFNSQFIIFCVITFLAGFFVEVVGVHTGYPFGEYCYRSTLGGKLFKVPLIIGLNWLMLVYSTGVICERFFSNIFVKSLCGALLMVILDYFIEPVAQHYFFWDWDSRFPPVTNYIGWFLVSFLLLLLFNKLRFNKQNPLAITLYMVQLVFFISFLVFP
jgi:putative membrane protein